MNESIVRWEVEIEIHGGNVVDGYDERWLATDDTSEGGKHVMRARSEKSPLAG